ncbi:MAG3450 family membrane protein [Mycoplasmopsis felifaucium]|uniref:MAG3450 family membrane protein n=1 Tax=Mycoplasmopsis felifaucium TaxID=35768 RepID=UPI0009FFB578|nr:hypothetical protein [Mycoplasmopsis felifaucium]
MNNKKQKTPLGPVVTILFISIFLVIPLSTIWILSDPKFGNQIIQSTLWIILGPCLIVFFALIINFICVYFKIINIRSFNFSIPIAFILIILCTFSLIPMPFWIKYIIAPIVGVLLALLSNITIGRIEDKLDAKK